MKTMQDLAFKHSGRPMATPIKTARWYHYALAVGVFFVLGAADSIVGWVI